MQRLLRVSTGDHSREEDTHPQECLQEGAALLEEGVQGDLS